MDQSLIRSGECFTECQAQVRRVLDALLADVAWVPRIPAGRSAALGHSAGGCTVLALAGAQAGHGSHCWAVVDAPGFCRLAQGGEARPASVPTVPVAPDPCIRAVVALAPMAVVLTSQSLAAVRIPVKVAVVEPDAVLASIYHCGHVAAHVSGVEYGVAPGAGHFAFMSEPTQSIAADPASNLAGF